jgi:hypothetical protein
MPTFRHRNIDLGYETLETETTPGSGRCYCTPAGKKYPSITTVLSILSKDSIKEWRARVGNEEANRVSRVAAGRGTSVHSLVEDYLNNKELDLKTKMPNAAASFRSIQPVLDGRIGEIYAQECALYSDHLRVAGRCDLVAEFDGKLSIVDIKTSSRVKTADDVHSYFMQEAAYAIMFEERTGIPVNRLVTVMSVDFGEVIVFKEKRDSWTKVLIETINQYYNQQL